MSINKEELFAKCLDSVNEQIERYRGKMDEISSRNEDNNFHPDFDQYGNKGEVLTQYEKNAHYLDIARNMKETLANLDRNHRSETIREGSLVETKNSYYYISVPLGQIDMEDGSRVYAISTEAPIYEHLGGKKAGEKFNFKDEEVEIVNIY